MFEDDVKEYDGVEVSGGFWVEGFDFGDDGDFCVSGDIVDVCVNLMVYMEVVEGEVIEFVCLFENFVEFFEDVMDVFDVFKLVIIWYKNVDWFEIFLDNMFGCLELLKELVWILVFDVSWIRCCMICFVLVVVKLLWWLRWEKWSFVLCYGVLLFCRVVVVKCLFVVLD